MSPSRRRAILFTLGILALPMLCVLVYLPGLPGEFLLDDQSSIVENPMLAFHHLTPSALFQASISAQSGGLLRPLSMLTFALNAYFFGMSPLAFKVTNIVIHLCCGLVLGLLSREILRAFNSFRPRALDDTAIARLSLAATMLWLVHPLNLVPVLYVVQRETMLATFFMGLAVFSYLVGRRRQLESKGHYRHWIWLLVPLYTLVGVLCKENAVLVPAYLFVIEFVLLRFRGPTGQRSREIQGFFLVSLALPLAAGMVVLAVSPNVIIGGYVGRDFTLYQRLLSEARIVLDYLHWVALPDIRQTGFFHDDIIVSQGLLAPPNTLLSIVGIALLLVGAIYLRSKLPLLSLGILWFFAGQTMESTILPLELAYEHRNYLPIFGLILGVIATLYLVAEAHAKLRLATVTLLAMLGILAGTTAVRASEWRDELTFALNESNHHPHSPRALSELQWAYENYAVTTKDASVVPQAIAAAERSKAADRGSINQDVGLASMFVGLGDLPKAKLYLESAAIGVKSATISSTLQFTLQSLSDMAEPSNRAIFEDMNQIFTNALANPALAKHDCYFANMWNTYAIFQRNIEQIPGSLNAMHRAVVLCPGDLRLRTNFIQLLLSYGDTKDAKTELDRIKDTHDLRYLPIVRSLQQQYAAAAAPSEH